MREPATSNVADSPTPTPPPLDLQVRRSCSQFVCIRHPGFPGADSGAVGDSVDSLNVSVAGGILLYALLNPRD